MARIDFQLVPRQHPQAIADRLRTHLANKDMADINIERLPGGYPGVHTPFEDPFIQRLKNVGARLYGTPLPLLPQGPFTQPLFFFAEAFGIPVAALGCALTIALCCSARVALAGPPLVPPQLIAACAKLADGAPCKVQFQEKTLSGICQALPDHSRACLPPKPARSTKASPKPGPKPEWGAHHRKLRGTHRHGPGAWRASVR